MAGLMTLNQNRINSVTLTFFDTQIIDVT